MAVLGVLVVAGWAGAFLLLAMGRLSLDLGWAGSVHPLGPITIRIAAPRELVFEIIEAPYRAGPLGRLGNRGARGKRPTRRRSASHHRPLLCRAHHGGRSSSSRRAGWASHLTGPVPHAVEQFTLTDSAGATELRYGGEIGIDFLYSESLRLVTGSGPVGANRPRASRLPRQGAGRAAGRRVAIATRPRVSGSPRDPLGKPLRAAGATAPAAPPATRIEPRMKGWMRQKYV